MTYKKDDPFNQTRVGPSIGASGERTMLDQVDDTDNYRTIIREHADGSVTLARTRGGWPEFATTKPEAEEPDEVVMFLETGHTELPTAGTAEQFYANRSRGVGKWWFKTSTAANWLGYIKNTLGEQHAVKNKGVGKTIQDGFADELADGMPSPATSVRLKNTGDWVLSMLEKRRSMQLCPASMFSGKMRLYMQARYGALLRTTMDIESADYGVKVDGITLGNLGGVGCGIYTTADNKYRLLRVVGDTVYVFKILPIDGYEIEVKKLTTRLNKGVDAAEREKIEAYIFAHSKIEPITNPAVQVFAGALPVVNPITYGWSFNWSGQKADIISHEVVGDGGNAKFHSTHYRLTINHSYLAGEDVWLFSYATLATDIWVDGRGSSHIFAPEYMGIGRHYLFSLGIPIASIGKSEGNIHCFYDKSDALVIARYVLSERTGQPNKYVSGATWPGAGGDQSNPACITQSVQQGSGSVTYTTYTNRITGYEAFHVGGEVHGGTFTGGLEQVERVDHGGFSGVGASPTVGWYVISPWNSLGGGFGYPVLGQDELFSMYQSFFADPYSDKYNDASSDYEFYGSTRESYPAVSAIKVFHSLVIPYYDACAVVVYKQDKTNSGAITFTWSKTSSNCTVVTDSRWEPFGNPNHPLAIHGGTMGPGNDGYSPQYVWQTETRTKDRGPPTYTKNVRGFHGPNSGPATEPHNVLEDMFIVDISYPYYDDLVWVSENAGGFASMEDPLHPTASRRWTGWV